MFGLDDTGGVGRWGLAAAEGGGGGGRDGLLVSDWWFVAGLFELIVDWLLKLFPLPFELTLFLFTTFASEVTLHIGAVTSRQISVDSWSAVLSLMP